MSQTTLDQALDQARERLAREDAPLRPNWTPLQDLEAAYRMALAHYASAQAATPFGPGARDALAAAVRFGDAVLDAWIKYQMIDRSQAARADPEVQHAPPDLPAR